MRCCSPPIVRSTCTRGRTLSTLCIVNGSALPSPHQLSWLNYPQSHKPRQGGALPKLELENKRESIPAFLSADKGLSCCCTQVVITFKKAADAQLIECTWCIRQNATQIKQLNLKRPQNQGSHVGLEAGKCLNVEVLQTWDISWRNPTSNIFVTV